MPEIAARTEPPVVTFRSEPAVMFDIANDDEVPLPSEELPEFVKFVEKRLPPVNAVEDAYGNCDDATVDDEKNTPWLQIEDVVAAEVVPNVLA